MKNLIRIVVGSVVILAGLVLAWFTLLYSIKVHAPIPAFVLGGPVLVLGGLVLRGLTLLLPRSAAKDYVLLIGGGALVLGLVLWGLVLLLSFSESIEAFFLIGGSVLLLGVLVLGRLVLLLSPLESPAFAYSLAVLVVMVLLLGGIIQVMSGGIHIYYEGAYRGKVVDAETGAPLAGAVVLGVWHKSTCLHCSPVFYRAREVVTDVNGDFVLPGVGLRIMSRVEPMDVFLFKAGYEYLERGFWAALQVDPILRKEINGKGKKALIPLKKLTLEERKEQGTPSRPNIPEEKMQRLTEEVNKDRVEQGLKPL